MTSILVVIVDTLKVRFPDDKSISSIRIIDTLEVYTANNPAEIVARDGGKQSIIQEILRTVGVLDPTAWINE